MRAESGSKRALNVTALFAGVGGLELGLERAGHSTSLLCEKDPEAAAVLRTRFPQVPQIDDVRKRSELLDAIDRRSNLLTAGFPCTDISQAGKTRGFNGGQSSLVRHVFRLLQERSFQHVLLENVPNWRFLHAGTYMEEVLHGMERLGYRWAYRTIDARAFGLPQRRQRIFLYATKQGDPRDVLFDGDVQPRDVEFDLTEEAHGFYWTEGNRGLGWGENCVPTLKGGSTVGIPSAPAILCTDGDIITPDIRDAERLQGFPQDWTSAEYVGHNGSMRPFNQRKRWLLVGNAINVQVAQWLGRQLASPRPFGGDIGKPLPQGSRFPSAAYCDGRDRFSVAIGTWPVSRQSSSLEKFLEYEGKPLSHKATLGFYNRARASRLDFVSGFLGAVQRHLKKMQA
jgi:DNA (cytosine-5)-methyltransferase 1